MVVALLLSGFSCSALVSPTVEELLSTQAQQAQKFEAQLLEQSKLIAAQAKRLEELEAAQARRLEEPEAPVQKSSIADCGATDACVEKCKVMQPAKGPGFIQC